jgi:hypothetical protein
MFDLKTFQSEAAKLIASRYVLFANHPDRPRKGTKPRPLADAVRLAQSTPEIQLPVLWPFVRLGGDIYDRRTGEVVIRNGSTDERARMNFEYWEAEDAI